MTRKARRPLAKRLTLLSGSSRSPKPHGFCRARLHAGRHVVAGSQGPPLVAGLVASSNQPVMAERALFDHPFGADRHIRVQSLFHRRGPFRREPVEIANGIRTSRRTIAAPDAPTKDLADDPLLALVRCFYRAHLDTRRIVAMHTGARQHLHLNPWVFSLDERNDIHPREGAARYGFSGI